MMSSKSVTLLILAVWSSALYAAAPQIGSAPDQRANSGSVYSYNPNLISGDSVLWTKAYGPDDVSVHPGTGAVSWVIPTNLPQESFHIGVRATNIEGEAVDTWILTVGSGDVVYIGPNESVKTLKAGLAEIKSGDTLIMRDGTWKNVDNTIPGGANKNQTLPEGSPTAYTTLMAENPGKVIIDGENEIPVMHFWGTNPHPDWPDDFSSTNFQGKTDYLAVKGIAIINSYGGAIRIDNARNLKFINMGLGNSVSSSFNLANMYINQSRYVLVEGAYAWGHGRYKIQFKNSSEGVVRRSVVRMDNAQTTQPIGGFVSYCSKNITFQNNILIDSDQQNFWTSFTYQAGAFGIAATNCYEYPENNVFRRSLALKSNVGFMGTDARQNANPTIWEDVVGWDLKPDRYFAGTQSHFPLLSATGASLTNRVTIGQVYTSPGYNIAGGNFLYARNSFDSIVKNSILYRLGWDGEKNVDQGGLIRTTDASGTFYLQHTNIVDFKGELDGGSTKAPTMEDNMDVAPQFRYITKLPDNSALRTAGENGGRVGAEILTMIGKSGTLHGESGYDDETNIPMWPFPAEWESRRHMKSYSYTGTGRDNKISTLTGNRGFAADNETLSNYVWTHLGTTAPPFNVRAIGGDGQITIKWDPPASKALSGITGYKVYRTDTDSPTVIGTVVGNSATSLTIAGLTNGQTMSVAVTASSASGGESDIVYPVQVTPEEKPKPLPPELSAD